MSAFFLLVLSSVFLFASHFYLWRVSCNRQEYTKERLAFACLTAVTTITTTTISALLAQTTPWDVVAMLFSWITTEPRTSTPPDFADYALVALVYPFAIAVICTVFQQSKGLRTQRQYQIEQRREEMSLVIEGVRELLRLIRRADPPPLYQLHHRRVPTQLPTEFEHTPWHIRARDLLKIKSPSYVFADDSWHDEAKCWVGRDTHTNELICVRCTPTAMPKAALSEFMEYALRLTTTQNTPGTVLVVAIEEPLHGSCDTVLETDVRYETEDTLLDAAVNWEDYRSDINRRMCHDTLPDSTLTIEDVFVAPNCIPARHPTVQPRPLQDHLDNWLQDTTQRHVALLGDYGQGKSTAVLDFVHKNLTTNSATRIPVLIELRGQSPRNMNRQQLLGAWSQKYHIDALALWYLHVAGRLVLIFDGFDEMALAGDAEMRLKHFRTLWTFCTPRAKLLITGRPNLFFDEAEMVSALGISEPIPGKPYCEPIRLKEFGLEQIKKALRRHPPPVREEITHFAEQNLQFAEVVSRPSLLHIVSVLWLREGLSQQLSDLTSAYVMNLFVRHSYRRQGRKEDESSEFMALTSTEREYFMKGIATYMAAKQLPNQIAGSQLNDAILTLIEAIPDEVTRRASTIDGEVRDVLRERMANMEHPVDHVQTDVRTCGILVEDPATSGAFRFGHKSFMEYLFAEVVAAHISEQTSPDSSSILKACGARPGDIAHLPVAVKFLSELLGTNITNTHESYRQQTRVARQILRSLLGDTYLEYFTGRLFLYESSLTQSIASISRGPNRLFLGSLGFFIRPSTLSLAVPVMAVGVSVGASISGSTNVFSLGLTFFLAGLWAAVVSVAYFQRIVVRRLIAGGFGLNGNVGVRTALSGIFVWNKLCKELGLDDRVLFRIAGIAWLPWCRSGSFDFFLGKERED